MSPTAELDSRHVGPHPGRTLARSGRFVWWWSICLLIALTPSTARAGLLDSIREDVREAPPADASSSSDDRNRDRDRRRRRRDDYDDPAESALGEFVCTGVFYGVTSPVWLPYGALQDDFQTEMLFPRFPYDQAPVAMTEFCELGGRRWSARFNIEYGTASADLDQLGGRLLMSTSSRFGLDVQMQRFEERLRNGDRDRLWLGDGNLVFRFAQSERMQWRAGLGMNWLDDPIRTDYGVNFTYGVDWFPARPWVLSATLDWGTLGRAELFRFHGSAGVLINRVETYIGYEYLDIDRTQINSLMAGLRIWF